MDLRWPLRIVEGRRDDVLVLTLAGRLGAESAARLEAVVVEAIGRGDVRLVIDLAGVDYVSSAGLTVLGKAAELCVGARGALVLCGLVDAVRMAADLGGLTAQIPIEPSQELATVRVATAARP
jgi:anti-sigma B factor antagonist